MTKDTNPITDYNEVAGIVQRITSPFSQLRVRVIEDKFGNIGTAKTIYIYEDGEEVTVLLDGEWLINFASSHYNSVRAHIIIGLIDIARDIQQKLNREK